MATTTHAAGDTAGAAKRVPVLVLTGFLGAGKTTLLQRLIAEGSRRGDRMAVIENDYGAEMGLDAALVAGASDKAAGTGAGGGTDGPATKRGKPAAVTVDVAVEFRELAGGCACCSVRGELTRIFETIALRDASERPDVVLLELTGLADPQPVASLLIAGDEDSPVRNAFYLSRVVTVVDAGNIAAALDDVKPDGVRNEAEVQLAIADTVIVNKCDLADDAGAEAARRVRALNSTATVVHATRADVDVAALLDDSGFNLDQALEASPQLLAEEHHMHDASIESVGVFVDGPVTRQSLGAVLDTWLVSRRSAGGDDEGDLVDVLRTKGVFEVVGDPLRVVVQGVRGRWELLHGSPWRDGESRRGRLVLIGRGLMRADIQSSVDSAIVRGTDADEA